AIELRCELRLGHSEAQVLDAFKSIAGVSWNPARIVGKLIEGVLVLDKTDGRQRPVFNVLLRRNLIGKLWDFGRLLKKQSHTWGSPQLREKFLAVMLHKLQGSIA